MAQMDPSVNSFASIQLYSVYSSLILSPHFSFSLPRNLIVIARNCPF